MDPRANRTLHKTAAAQAAASGRLSGPLRFEVAGTTVRPPRASALRAHFGIAGIAGMPDMAIFVWHSTIFVEAAA